MSPILGIWASQISGHLYTPVGSYDALATITVPSGGISAATFSSIPTGYRHLELRYISRSNQSGGTSSLKLQLNGDTGSNYVRYHEIYGDGSSATAYYGSASTYMQVDQQPGATATANVFSAGILTFTDYASSTKNKTMRFLDGFDTNSNGAIVFGSSLWMNTTPVTSISVFDYYGANLSQYSQFALYGIR